MDNIGRGNELILEALQVRDALALLGGHERLLAKLDGLLINKVTWHGGEQITLRNHIEAAKSCLAQS